MQTLQLNLLVRATASILLKDSVYFTHTHTHQKKKKKTTISILHHHFFQNTNINPSITHYILYKLYFYILFLILFYLCHFFFLILPHLSSSFFCLISLSFPLSFSSSSFFFFLSQSDQHSITSTTTIKTHKHHQTLSTHKHLSTPPASIHIIDPHHWSTCSDSDEITSPIHNPLIHGSTITNQWSTSYNPQSKHHKHDSSRPTTTCSQKCSLSLLVYLCVSVFDFWLILWCDRVWICLIFDWFCGVSVLWWWLAVLGCGDNVRRCWVTMMWVVVMSLCG